MTTAQQDYLLNLYTTLSIDEIDADFGAPIAEVMGKANYAELKEDNAFNEYNLLLKNCQAQVKKIKAIGDPRSQLCDVIDDLYSKLNQRNEEKYMVCLKFYKITLYPKWVEKFQKVFDFAVQQIIGRKHVFISYTNRDAALNNSLYLDLIEKLLPMQVRDDPANSSKNLIAWIIKQNLIDANQLTGYFDQDKSQYEYGRSIPDLLQKYCETSFSFLQLLEKRTFDRADENTQRNYCYEEYTYFSTGYQPINEAMKNVKSDNVFIVRSLTVMKDNPEIVYPVNFPDNYNDWKQKINPLNYMKIYSGMPVGELLMQLETFTKNIKDRAEEILKNYKVSIMSLAD